jgi:hypothetical protein
MPELSGYVDLFYQNLPLHAGIVPAVAMIIAAIIHPAVLSLVTLLILAAFAYIAAHVGYFGLPITVDGQQLETNATLIELGLAALAVIIFYFILSAIFKAMARASA